MSGDSLMRIFPVPKDFKKSVGGVFGLGADKDIKNATNDIKVQNDAAIKKLQDSQEQSSVKETDNVKRRMARFTQTNYSSPLGISGQANVARKTLLGQ